MKQLSQTVGARLLSSVAFAVVIASLCFSVGEGLRLTPFPTSNLARAEAANVLSEAKVSDQTSLYKYGPLDVPAQSQKRNKRQALDLAGPPTVAAREIPNNLYLLATSEPLDVLCVPSVSRPAGRAPPFAS